MKNVKSQPWTTRKLEPTLISVKFHPQIKNHDSFVVWTRNFFGVSLHKARISILYSISGCRKCEIVRLFLIEKDDKIYSDRIIEGRNEDKDFKKTRACVIKNFRNLTVFTRTFNQLDLTVGDFVVGTLKKLHLSQIFHSREILAHAWRCWIRLLLK